MSLASATTIEDQGTVGLVGSSVLLGASKECDILLEPIKRTDPRILTNMAIHYSQPKGFVGRNICYAVMLAGVCYGSIAGGSATRFLPGREIIGTLNNGVNNIFYHVEPGLAGYGRLPAHGVIGVEMESAALYTLAARFGARAVTICTMTDCLVTGAQIDAEARQTSLKDMVALALDVATE